MSLRTVSIRYTLRMRLRLEGAPLPDLVLMLLSQHDFEVVSDAQAEGSVCLVEDKVVLTLPMPDEDALYARAVSAMNMLATAIPEAVAALSVGATAAAAAR